MFPWSRRRTTRSGISNKIWRPVKDAQGLHDNDNENVGKTRVTFVADEEGSDDEEEEESDEDEEWDRSPGGHPKRFSARSSGSYASYSSNEYTETRSPTTELRVTRRASKSLLQDVREPPKILKTGRLTVFDSDEVFEVPEFTMTDAIVDRAEENQQRTFMTTLAFQPRPQLTKSTKKHTTKDPFTQTGYERAIKSILEGPKSDRRSTLMTGAMTVFDSDEVFEVPAFTMTDATVDRAEEKQRRTFRSTLSYRPSQIGTKRDSRRSSSSHDVEGDGRKKKSHRIRARRASSVLCESLPIAIEPPVEGASKLRVTNKSTHYLLQDLHVNPVGMEREEQKCFDEEEVFELPEFVMADEEVNKAEESRKKHVRATLTFQPIPRDSASPSGFRGAQNPRGELSLSRGDSNSQLRDDKSQSQSGGLRRASNQKGQSNSRSHDDYDAQHTQSKEEEKSQCGAERSNRASGEDGKNEKKRHRHRKTGETGSRKTGETGNRKTEETKWHRHRKTRPGDITPKSNPAAEQN